MGSRGRRVVTAEKKNYEPAYALGYGGQEQRETERKADMTEQEKITLLEEMFEVEAGAIAPDMALDDAV